MIHSLHHEKGRLSLTSLLTGCENCMCSPSPCPQVHTGKHLHSVSVFAVEWGPAGIDTDSSWAESAAEAPPGQRAEDGGDGGVSAGEGAGAAETADPYQQTAGRSMGWCFWFIGLEHIHFSLFGVPWMLHCWIRRNFKNVHLLMETKTQCLRVCAGLR